MALGFGLVEMVGNNEMKETYTKRLYCFLKKDHMEYESTYNGYHQTGRNDYNL